MAETSSVTKPAKPEYLRIPMPSPNGKDEEASQAALGASQPVTVSGVRSIEEVTAAPRGSDALIEAVNTVRRVVTARIAWHERELRALREALAPFGAASRQNVTSENSSGNAAVDALLQLADTLKLGEGDTP
jgi:hypothetical protein